MWILGGLVYWILVHFSKQFLFNKPCNMMVKSFFKRLINLINFTLLIICIINSCEVSYKLANPELPSIREYETNLKDIEFPISFKICLYNLNETYDRYHRLGYEDKMNFFLGRSKYNKSHYGWNGHTEDGATIGPTEG